MLIEVDPSSSCDICSETHDWGNPQWTPHIINCSHIFCAECLDQVSPTKCPMCREIFFCGEVQKLPCRSHIVCPEG
ncbi:hypothetical protein BDP27DRAFT_377908 [Rhodocollybia butyracea]|uniref:RING-type domain-containing protein n=1 Tax=Rhodocollybia butyracea TaxID=206335 RepID=A0A9P5PFD0_9AGAR|nr:hypothetical protein BDP27DRAFT_377908 [Rhodocollybia butyracea]